MTAQLENWKKEVLEYRIQDSARAIRVCAEIEKYAQKNKDFENLAFTLFYSGECHYALNEVDDVIEQMTKAVVYLSLSKQWELLARAQNILAIATSNKGNAMVALDYYLAGIRTCREHNVTAIYCSIHINLGFLYMKNGVYREAQRCFDEAYEAYQKTSEEEKKDPLQIARLTMIYANLATCYMLQGEMDKTKRYLERIGAECEPYFENVDYVYVDCVKARFYHKVGDFTRRDECVADIDARIEENMSLLDLFDDLEGVCLLLLEIRKYDSFLHITDQLQKVVEPSEVMDIERRLLELKLEYYRAIGDDEEYRKATGWFYELARVMDKASGSMISNMLYIRTSLEHANEQRKRIEEENAILTRRSETDALTGLANRYRLTEYFDQTLETCRQNGELLAVEILDVDYFKEYNDNYGHQAGDECIQAIASLLKEMEDKNVFCARYGGDEFIIIYNGLDASEVQHRAEQLQQDVVGLQRKHEHSKCSSVVTISQGICQDIPEVGNKSWDFLHVADEMLYRGKKTARNSIFVGDLRSVAERPEGINR